MSKLMEQVKIASQDIDKSLQNIDKDYEPIDKIQEPEKEDKNKKDVKNNFSEFIIFSDPKDFEIQNFGAGTAVIKGAKTVGGKIAKFTRKIDPDINDTIKVITEPIKDAPKKAKSFINFIKDTVKNPIKQTKTVTKNIKNYSKNKKDTIKRMMKDPQYRKSVFNNINVQRSFEKGVSNAVAASYAIPIPGVTDIAATVGASGIYASRKLPKIADAVKYGYDLKRNAIKSAFKKDIESYFFDENKKDDYIKGVVVGGTAAGVTSGISDATKNGIKEVWKIIYIKGKKLLIKIK